MHRPRRPPPGLLGPVITERPSTAINKYSMLTPPPSPLSFRPGAAARPPPPRPAPRAPPPVPLRFRRSFRRSAVPGARVRGPRWGGADITRLCPTGVPPGTGRRCPPPHPTPVPIRAPGTGARCRLGRGAGSAPRGRRLWDRPRSAESGPAPLRGTGDGQTGVSVAVPVPAAPARSPVPPGAARCRSVRSAAPDARRHVPGAELSTAAVLNGLRARPPPAANRRRSISRSRHRDSASARPDHRGLRAGPRSGLSALGPTEPLCGSGSPRVPTWKTRALLAWAACPHPSGFGENPASSAPRFAGSGPTGSGSSPAPKNWARPHRAAPAPLPAAPHRRTKPLPTAPARLREGNVFPRGKSPGERRAVVSGPGGSVRCGRAGLERFCSGAAVYFLIPVISVCRRPATRGDAGSLPAARARSGPAMRPRTERGAEPTASSPRSAPV